MGVIAIVNHSYFNFTEVLEYSSLVAPLGTKERLLTSSTADTDC